MQPNDQLLTVKQVADIFAVTPYTVRAWLTTGILEGVKIGTGHYWRIPKSEVERLANRKFGDESDRPTA